MNEATFERFYMRRVDVAALFASIFAMLTVFAGVIGLLTVFSPVQAETLPTLTADDSAAIYHRTIVVQGVEVAYREAGDPANPTVCYCTAFRRHRKCIAT